jgi:hypothetical protein
MALIPILVVLVVVGVLLYLVEAVIPMDASIKLVIKVIVILAVCLWLLQIFGLLGGHPVTLR